MVEATLSTPAANLALDEALLEGCDAGGLPASLRIWEPREVFVVVGYSNRVDREVEVEACRRLGVPILRRCSGGGTVVQMPGVMNYNLVLPIPDSGPFSTLAGTNREVMDRIRRALSAIPQLAGRLLVRGVTDLCVDDRKCLGNAQRRKRAALVFHGSFLMDANLGILGQLLQFPSKQPDYRQGRSHDDFCCNLGLEPGLVKTALASAFGATPGPMELPMGRVSELVESKYSQTAWNERSLQGTTPPATPP